jgi:outer membrane receptor protein involved in Fe transport
MQTSFERLSSHFRLITAHCGIAFIVAIAVLSLPADYAHAQATASLQGIVTDSSRAVIPNAKIVAHNLETGEDRDATSDSAGVYALPSLPVGTYRLNITAAGMQSIVVSGVDLEVGQIAAQNFTLQVASSNEVVQVTASTPLITSETTTVGAVMNSRTVQDIPLNGRHFLDMGFLIPGSVTPPQNATLAAPLRGQGFFGFNTAGGREDTVNFMVNGVNLNDFGGGNQITFQPTIGTIQEFKVENSTFRAEYGFKSGAIVNMVTRSGTNQWHGEIYDYLRNNALDARNYENPVGQPMAAFHRNQFGVDGGGPIRKDKTFFYLSYEGLRHYQSVPLSATVLSPAQRQQALTSSDPVIQKLLTLIPLPNAPGNVYQSTAIAPVTSDQGTADVSHSFSETNQLNVYFAYQEDFRNEPSSTVGNNLPGYGDLRIGNRQALTISDTKTLSGTFVNEFHLGYNRIHLPFNPQTSLTADTFGIDSGVYAFPQIIIGGGSLEFGGANGEPLFRGDYTAVLSDGVDWVRGKHTIKFGGEYRRNSNNNYSYTPGTFTFPTITNFLNDQATGFTANASNRASRIFMNTLGLYMQDTYKVVPSLLLELGFRYDWNGTPVEAENRFVVFDPETVSLTQVGGQGGPGKAYDQNALNFEPRVGVSWDPLKTGKTVVRAAYAIQTDSPNTGQVIPLAQNPPFADPVSFSPTAATPYVNLTNAYAAAGGIVSPTTITPDYKNDYIQSWNANVQQALGSNMSLMIGYFAAKGTHLNIESNLNQPINGLHPYNALSTSSPIDPGKPLGVITLMRSSGNSSYNALWATVTKRLSRGLQFSGSYTLSESLDYNSKTAQGIVVQNSYDLRGDRGLSDFDARNRFSLNGIYELPFSKNRIVSGWQLAPIVTLQSGNPINFKTSNGTFTGVATLRPSVTGRIHTGFSAGTNNNATYVTYIQNPSVFYDPGNAFGNLGRNAVIGPGFSNVDLALIKNTIIHQSDSSNVRLQFRADTFDILNHPNFGQPNLTLGSSTFGLISSTRFPTGDSGSSRQMQLALKLIF